MGGYIAQCLGRDHSDRILSLIIGGSGLPTEASPDIDPFIAEWQPGMEAYVAAREALRGAQFPETTRRLFLQNDARALIVRRRGTQHEPPWVPSSNVRCMIYAAAGDLPIAERLFEEVPSATFIPCPTSTTGLHSPAPT
jgi:pimeloyl-ACP methyl ester carboxylesterase